MTASNLGICFGPNFVGEGALDGETAMHDQTSINAGVALMIERFEETFAGLDISDKLIMNEEDLQELRRTPVNIQHIRHEMVRRTLRHGKLIPYVPICRLMAEWQPPSRSPSTQPEDDEEKIESIMASFDPSDEFKSKMRSRSGGKRALYRASIALANDILQGPG
jgi:hypothetical protein